MDNMNLSAASIRNVMQDLEGLGLVYSPHISSGRIPTETGLRLFVDAMLEVGNLTNVDEATIKEQALQNNISIEDALSKASEMLSGLTNCAGVVSVNKDSKSIKHIEFVSLEKNKVLVVLVDEEGNVENRIINNSDGITSSSLAIATNYLNHHMRGYTLDEAIKKIKADLVHKELQIDKETAKILWTRVKETFPELDNLPETEITRFLNAIENIAKTEGPEAITSDRIQGMRELFEEVIWADPIFGLNTQKDN